MTAFPAHAAFPDDDSRPAEPPDDGAALVAAIELRSGRPVAGKAVLEVGPPTPAVTAALARSGAEVTLLVASEAAAVPARNALPGRSGADVMVGDLLSPSVRETLSRRHFDVVLLNGVLDRVADAGDVAGATAGLLAPDGWAVSRSRNGRAARTVLSEPYSKIVGLSLLAPDMWALFGLDRVRAYYKSWSVVRGAFLAAGFRRHETLVPLADASHDLAVRAVAADLARIKAALKPEKFAGTAQFKPIRIASLAYIAEAREALAALAWPDIDHLYRATHWDVAFAKT